MMSPRARRIGTAAASAAIIAVYAFRVPTLPVQRVSDVMVVIFLFALACSSIEKAEKAR